MSTRSLRWLLPVALVVAAVSVGWFAFTRPDPTPTPPTTPSPIAETEPARPDPAPPDPRVAFTTPFRNVRPGVKYVGDAACTGCHADVAKHYRDHPMGRSAEFTKPTGPVEKYDATAKNPFHAGAFDFHVERGDGVTHRVVANTLDYTAPIHLTIGSGTHGRSYLTNCDGALWQSAISWFAREARWDVSPGLDPARMLRRPATAYCLFCHVNQSEPVPHAVNRFQPITGQAHIGCERCHGPGELHVAERKAEPRFKGVDHSIVNPKHLSAELRDDVCRQCHLQGVERVVRRGRSLNEYRPGLPWDQFVAVFVRPPETAEAYKQVGQLEQMERSRCFTASAGKLGCTSCHDPHQKPANPAVFYRDKCLTCHNSKGCSLPLPERQRTADNCVACHMPKADSINVSHTSLTDHRVPRKPRVAAPKLEASGLPIIAYRAGPHAPPLAERERDHGIALARFAEASSGGPSGPQGRFATFAEDLLTASLRRWPGDAAGWQALATAREARGDWPGAMRAARSTLALAPDSEEALLTLTFTATTDGQTDVALGAADKLVVLNPTAPDYWATRATAHMSATNWAKAEADLREALKLQSLAPRTRVLLAVCRHRQGDAAGAQKELDLAVSLVSDPRAKAAFQEQFRGQTR